MELLYRPEWFDDAIRIMYWISKRKNHYGHDILNTKAVLTEIGLFNGIAGVGYIFSRVENMEDGSISVCT